MSIRAMGLRAWAGRLNEDFRERVVVATRRLEARKFRELPGIALTGRAAKVY
jgi:hypothetical protein